MDNCKKIEWKLMFTALLPVILLFSGVFASSAPIVNAAEPTVQDEAVDVLCNVVGFNAEKYAVFPGSQIDSQYISLPQKEVAFTLMSNQGGVRVSFSFVNNMVRQIYLSNYEGDLAVKKPAIATVDMAKGFLQRYQKYAGYSLYGELASMLNDVDVSNNITKSAGNIRLEVLNWNQTIVDYVWTYIDENGVIAKSKNVVLSYDQGQLKVFSNNWPLYKIAGKPKISSEEATKIAIEASKSFSYKVEMGNATITVTGFKIAPESLGHATLSYLNFPNQSLARGGDPFTLYPSWYVPLGFDKVYPGGVTGIAVSIWADTGEISIIRPMVVAFPSNKDEKEAPPTTSNQVATGQIYCQEQSTPAPFMVCAIFIVILTAIIGVKNRKFADGRKPFKFCAALLCGVIASSLILVAMPTAFADAHMPHSKARIYAALEGGQGSPSQLPEEKAAAYWVAGEIADAFTYSGYNVSNHAGTYTCSYWILTNAQNDEQNFDRVALFHFGHMAEFQKGYVDNYGTPVLASEIDQRVSTYKYFFVFIWVCAQANDHDEGTPAAWTSRTNLSDNGYVSPDGRGQCYIGFKGISPQIGNISVFGYQMVNPLKVFIKSFYYYALKRGYSVKESLNRATLDFFGTTFTSSILYTGYDAWFPGDSNHTAGYYYGQMRVFGDGNVMIVQPRITLSANTPVAPWFYLDGVPHGLGDINTWAWPRQYTIQVSDIPCYQFSHFHYTEAFGSCTWDIYYKPVTISFEYPGTFTAVYTPIPQPLTISSSGAGYTNPEGTHMYDPYTYVLVEAFPNSGWDHYWLLDGYYAGISPSINVYMNGPRNLQAVFYPEQQNYFVAGIHNYAGPVYTPQALTGWENDGQFAVLEGWGPYEDYGWISGGMNAPAAGHIYIYGCGYGPLYVYVSSDWWNWNHVNTIYVAQTSPHWIDCGTYLNPFNYILLTAEDPYDFSHIEIDSVKVEPPVYHTLTISSGSGGSTNPLPGAYQYAEGTLASVTAIPESGYVLDYWLLDGQNVGGQNPITVTMNSDHNLQAVFRQGTYYWLTVDAYDGYAGNPVYPNIYVDGNWAGCGYAHIQVTEGWHTVWVDEWVWNEYLGCYDYLAYFTDGYGNGSSRPVYADTYLTAIYYPWW
jgi:hypothetical protein